jgi:hypothetical protein
VNSKYAKYSTEQLEVILSHLTDPDEKELVKKKISERYYQHYLNVGNAPEDQPPPAVTPAQEAPSSVAASSEEDQLATGGRLEEYLLVDEDLAGIAEVAPIELTLPASPGTAADLAEKSTSDTTAKKKFCFIATAAYGSPLAHEVVLLQTFRDRYLFQHALGEKFIQVYYRSSPYLAGLIKQNEVLKLLTRYLLAPLIWLIKKTSVDLGRS